MASDIFTPGQRWICDAELQLGLGTVLSSDFRTVTILFPATGEQRTYAKQSAPLTRVKFAAGDSVQTQEGWSLSVDAIYEEEGLITYVGYREDASDGSMVELGEVLLDNFMQLNRPVERLLNGQVDSDKWFELRYQTHLHQSARSSSEIGGLAGGRTALIPHQLYIAHEVAKRYAPRVLLADEVGLGKTIEAGLILHQQLLTEQARRVLIVVPESLVHQWLVEMLRRFNLHFTILDEARCQALDESSGQSNPFHTEQLILCNLGFLVSNPLRYQQALQGEWDLLVVDEAHHLEWSPEEPSVEYQAIEALAQTTQGVLLLTATPEQLGKESHFARLRLLDSDRFSDYQDFLKEEESYRPIADTVEQLISGEPFDEETRQVLLETLGEGDNLSYLQQLESDASTSDEKRQASVRLIEHLLDRHGTGRVLFRNTRDAVKGFPQRKVISHSLPLPSEYHSALQQIRRGQLSEPQLLLSPELLYQSVEESNKSWTEIDPRVEWLSQRIKQLYPGKVLVITSSAQSAIDIASHLLHRAGIHAALFHEGLSIVERDRAAAFFADHESGSQLLICSEIGSEGRNFQFAHHLIMFDLPLNPDLLEQRIGRLDRIGQRQTIEIEIPYLEQSAQEVIYRWYHEGLNAFEHNSPAGHPVFVAVREQLLEQLNQASSTTVDIEPLIQTTRELHQKLTEEMQQGRNKLLEYNSCRTDVANQLQALAQYEDTVSGIDDYLDQLFDCFGVDIEPHTATSHIIRPGEQMQTGSFPMLTEEGMTITYRREMALSHEDIHYITWAHPLVTGAMELVESSELGNSALTSLKYSGAKAGTLLLEVLFQLESTSQASSRYLPPVTIRVVVDAQGRDHAEKLTPEMIEADREFVNKQTAKTITQAYNQELQDMVELAEQAAQAQSPELIKSARQEAERMLNSELHRLKALQQINPSIRQDEIDFFEQALQQATAAVNSANLRLDGLRVIVVT